MNTGPDLAKLGRAIRTYRSLTNLTQDEIARRGGPSDVTIRGLENGVGKKPNASTLRKLDKGLGWPEGFSAKVLVGDADVLEEVDREEGVYPSLLDYTDAPDPSPWTPEGAQEAYENWQAERPIYEQSTADLITELAARYRTQEKRIRDLERELADSIPAPITRSARDDHTTQQQPQRPPRPADDHVDDDAVPDGATTPADADVPEMPDPFTLAAKRGVNRGRELRRRQDEAAEASQDPEG